MILKIENMRRMSLLVKTNSLSRSIRCEIKSCLWKFQMQRFQKPYRNWLSKWTFYFINQSEIMLEAKPSVFRGLKCHLHLTVIQRVLIFPNSNTSTVLSKNTVSANIKHSRCTSIKHQNSGQSSTEVKCCMYIMYDKVDTAICYGRALIIC